VEILHCGNGQKAGFRDMTARCQSIGFVPDAGMAGAGRIG